MIGRLSGVLAEKNPPYLLLEVNGVGYEVQASMTSIYHLGEVGEAVVLHTHLSVTETAHQLFGFYSTEERELFRALIKVSGVGPKLALSILSGIESAAFVACVNEGNTSALVKVPGVGKKTAERLVIEMRDRLKDWHSDASTVLESGAAKELLSEKSRAGDMLAEAESALAALGYKPTEAAKMVAAALEQHKVERSEDLIRLALRTAVNV